MGRKKKNTPRWNKRKEIATETVMIETVRGHPVHRILFLSFDDKFLLYFGSQLDIMCYIEDYEILEKSLAKLKQKQQKQGEKPLLQVIAH